MTKQQKIKCAKIFVKQKGNCMHPISVECSKCIFEKEAQACNMKNYYKKAKQYLLSVGVKI